MIRVLGLGFRIFGLRFPELPEWREKKAYLGLIDLGAVFQLLHRGYIGIDVMESIPGVLPHPFNHL